MGSIYYSQVRMGTTNVKTAPNLPILIEINAQTMSYYGNTPRRETTFLDTGQAGAAQTP